jgi:hypothetical protein
MRDLGRALHHSTCYRRMAGQSANVNRTGCSRWCLSLRDAFRTVMVTYGRSDTQVLSFRPIAEDTKGP